MEIVQINLVLHLELVDKIEEMESEYSTRTMPGGRKPAGTEKLDATIARLTFTSVVTNAVGDPNQWTPETSKSVRVVGGEGRTHGSSTLCPS